ncbi:MAG: Putative ATP-binding protein, partial [uncultured Sulfurovum sp.]
LHIEDYKMFKDFDIDFVDENDEALPIVVLAGVNGSGKTTLLESIFSLSSILFENALNNVLDKFFIEFELLNHIKKYTSEITHSDVKEVKKNILYFSVGQNLEDIKIFLPKYIASMVYEYEIPPVEVHKQVREYIDDILKELNPGIEFDSRDGEGNLFFRNKGGEDKFSIDNLSTGEKTLISKVLYMYLADIKDKVILIDEPELSLHPSWQNKVLKIYENFVEKNKCQIIIATHSPHIIGSAKPEYLRVLKKVDNKIEVAKYTKSYGLEFNKILTDIMGAETRVSDVSKRLSIIKSLIIKNDFDSDEFKTIWSDLEKLLGEDNIDLRLLKLEIASRKKNVSNN